MMYTMVLLNISGTQINVSVEANNLHDAFRKLATRFASNGLEGYLVPLNDVNDEFKGHEGYREIAIDNVRYGVVVISISEMEI